MNENNPPKISDLELERLIQTALNSTILTDEEINDIADSPRLWWQLQSRVAAEKSRQKQHWFFNWRWQTVTIGAVLFLFVAGAAIRFSDSPNAETAALTIENNIAVLGDKSISTELKPELISSKSNAPQTKELPTTRQRVSLIKTERNSLKTRAFRAETAPRQIAKAKTALLPKAATATEFIALSYLPASESGQIVRVKVPRSMMVSLGVSTNTERNKELVNAEVIVGDDGAARAIRFLNE